MYALCHRHTVGLLTRASRTDRVGPETAPRQQDDAGALGDLLRRLAIDPP
jgi:hypothetical protein